MGGEKQQRLDQAIAGIQHEWGQNALRRLGDARELSILHHVSTGFAQLDNALGIGGLPRSQLTHLCGAPTSGASTLACKVLAQPQGEAIVYLDLPRTFDADYADRCGVDTTALLLVQPPSLDHALETLLALVDTAPVAVLMVGSNQTQRRVDPASLSRLVTTLHRSACTLLLVERAGTPLFSEKAADRLHLQRERWLLRNQDVNGYRTRVRILKNQFGRAGHSVRLVIGFTGVVDGDGA